MAQNRSEFIFAEDRA